jgi:hypothetical protein
MPQFSKRNLGTYLDFFIPPIQGMQEGGLARACQSNQLYNQRGFRPG